MIVARNFTFGAPAGITLVGPVYELTFPELLAGWTSDGLPIGYNAGYYRCRNGRVWMLYGGQSAYPSYVQETTLSCAAQPPAAGVQIQPVTQLEAQRVPTRGCGTCAIRQATGVPTPGAVPGAPSSLPAQDYQRAVIAPPRVLETVSAERAPFPWWLLAIAFGSAYLLGR